MHKAGTYYSRSGTSCGSPVGGSSRKIAIRWEDLGRHIASWKLSA